MSEMGKICDCCGKEIVYNFYNLEYKGDVCKVCYDKVSQLQAGEISYAEVMTSKTTPELKEYLKECSQKGMERKKKQEEREANPLYSDIHQLANDVHFIKNYIIVCIILTVIAVLFYACQPMMR